MEDVFENIREQLHEIRNIVGPVDLKLSNLEHQFARTRTLLEERNIAIESRLSATIIRTDEQTSQISDVLEQNARLSERVRRIELILKIAPIPDDGKPLPTHEDKAKSLKLPPPGPAASG